MCSREFHSRDLIIFVGLDGPRQATRGPRVWSFELRRGREESEWEELPAVGGRFALLKSISQRNPAPPCHLEVTMARHHLHFRIDQ